jgi:hypothetical protein
MNTKMKKQASVEASITAAIVIVPPSASRARIKYEILPKCMQEARKRNNEEDKKYLSRFSSIMKKYKKFFASYSPKDESQRDMYINDSSELLAYFILNSRYRPTKEDICSNMMTTDKATMTSPISTHRIRDTPDSEVVIPKPAIDILWDEVREISKSLQQEASIISKYIYSLYKEPLETIRLFRHAKQRELFEPIPFIDDNMFLVQVRLVSFLEDLSIPYQAEIASGEWNNVALEERPISYILLVRLLFDKLLNGSLYSKHPHLLAISANVLKMVNAIIRQCKDEESMREACRSFSFISGIREALLVGKCLTCLQQLERGTLVLEFGTT